MKSLILFGNGGHCRSCIEVIENLKGYKIKGIIVHPSDLTKKFMNYEVLGNDSNFEDVFEENDLALICIGQIHSPNIRKKLFNLLKERKILLAKVFATNSTISKNSFVSAGCIIMQGVTINSGAYVGLNCILNTNSLIEHDVKIGNHCHISTGVILNGSVEIGNDCFLGSGAIVREGVKIGQKSIISAGQIVMKDIPPNTVFKG